MSYILILVTFLSALILLLQDLLSKAYKTILVVLACVFLVISFISQLIIESKRVPDLIVSYHEEIEDFRDWKSDEAKYRILGNIRRLSKLGEMTFDLNSCNLSELHLKGLKMKNSDMNCINLSRSYLSDCTFENVNFRGAEFAGATIVRSSFINCKIDSANYFDAILYSVDFRGSDLTHFDERNNLNKARVIYDSKNIDEQLLQMIRTQKPELLEKPDMIKMNRMEKYIKKE